LRIEGTHGFDTLAVCHVLIYSIALQRGRYCLDAVTLFGTPRDFTLSWADGEGAIGYTGLTLTATASGRPKTLLTLAGFNSAALTNGISSGTEPDGGPVYTYI
jgi:hypothetical protein